MRLGIQVSIAGRIYESLDRASRLDCDTMQIFSRNPRTWRLGKLDRQEIEEFKIRRKRLGIGPVFIHIPYLINLASPYKRLYKKSILAYIEDIKEAESLGADYIVTHLGSHKETSEKSGIKRFSRALNEIIAEAKTKVGILLENTAGSGSWLGYNFRHHQRIIDGLKDDSSVGICLDTCHAYVAGYNIAAQDGLDKLLNQIDSLIGLERLKLIHLNDAKDKLNSHSDRHEHIGKGRIGRTGFRRIINHPKLKDLAFILETPKKTEQDDIMNLHTVRALIN